MKTYGLKLLRVDGSNLNYDHGRITYPLGEWVEIPGNGAYVCISGGLMSGGVGPLLAWFECGDEVDGVADMPHGVRCYRRVRRLAAMPEDYAGPIRIAKGDEIVRGWSTSLLILLDNAQSHRRQGGDCYCIGDRSSSHDQQGGLCYCYGTHSSSHDQKGGYCYCYGAHSSSHDQKGGYCYYIGEHSQSVNKKGGWCNKDEQQEG